MAQKVYDYFGISLDIEPDVNEADYIEFRDQLISHLTQLPDIDLNNVEVYIHQLRITIESACFGVSPLEARLSKLDVSIETHHKAKLGEHIWFLNHNIPLKLNPDNTVEVKARRHRISYSLTGEYCSQHAGYSDYLATIVMSDCPTKLKKLSVTGTAHATDQYRPKLYNLNGLATTKLPFILTRERQLYLPFKK